MTIRKRKNTIKELKDRSGRGTSINFEMEKISRSFFQDLFASKGTGNVDHLLSGINRCIFNELIMMLT